LDQEQLLAGLLALASVLGVGEGHLLHRETRWAGSRYFAKSESLFQSFPNTKVLTLACRHVVFGRGASRARDGSKKRKNYVA
ncbi:hypothetical protein, partial [Pseudomonas aeruginosa]|uniref:hypothetical protein n=1 Tax=Pseudomonas aeruginosa TaxID=287 RepID=UPI001E47E559